MTPENWQTIKEILVDSMERPAADRPAFLERSGLDPELLREVESLLAGESDADRVMGISAIEFAGDLLPDSARGIEGSRIGSYLIEREIGFGGMGAVYLARRADGKFEQQVAIKMLRRELNAPNVRRAFEREKNIQAKLDHPGIAKMLDAGTTEDGVPYFAMEYVDGIAIDEYCESRSLGHIERLKLFAKVCDAVESSHQKLIVHRDLKPSNILVSPDGQPKVLDFGISKLLNADDEGQSATLLRAMTPKYASPEQINGESVTTATDVYSLGIVLFKILTGRHPFESDAKTNGSFIKAISEGEPTAPSVAVRRNPETVIRDAQLRGDLDNIVLKAIRNQPDERYRTVEQLSADIWRFIDGMPIIARPATLSYRARKFVGRNRITAIASALVFIALVTGIALAGWQANVANDQARLAVTETEKANSEKAKAEKVSRFMMKIISYANPGWHAEGYRYRGEARVIDALDDMASKIDAEFADQPDVLAELHHQFSDAYLSRNKVDGGTKAREHAQRALELRRSYYGDWHELVAKDMVFVYWTRPPGTTEADVQLLSDAIVMLRATNPENLNLPFMLETYWHRMSDDIDAEFHEMFLRHVPGPAPQDKYLAADKLFDEMLDLLRRHFAEDNSQVVFQKCNGMVLKLKAGKTAEAESFYQTCKQAAEAAPGLRPQLEMFRKVAGRTD